MLTMKCKQEMELANRDHHHHDSLQVHITGSLHLLLMLGQLLVAVTAAVWNLGIIHIFIYLQKSPDAGLSGLHLLFPLLECLLSLS